MYTLTTHQKLANARRRLEYVTRDPNRTEPLTRSDYEARLLAAATELVRLNTQNEAERLAWRLKDASDRWAFAHIA